jgi:hypothetical protein
MSQPSIDIEVTAAPAVRRRPRTAILFATALLGFQLPFATVSCDTPVTFTGLQLATASVPEHDDAELARDIEHNGTVVAAIALVCVALGFGLVLAGLRGSGAAAVLGLLALLLLPWICIGSLADFELHEGYVLSVGSLAAVAALRRVDSFTARIKAGRRAWPAVILGVLLALPLVATVILTTGTQVPSG